MDCFTHSLQLTYAPVWDGEAPTYRSMRCQLVKVKTLIDARPQFLPRIKGEFSDPSKIAQLATQFSSTYSARHRKIARKCRHLRSEHRACEAKTPAEPIRIVNPYISQQERCAGRSKRVRVILQKAGLTNAMVKNLVGTWDIICEYIFDARGNGSVALRTINAVLRKGMSDSTRKKHLRILEENFLVTRQAGNLQLHEYLRGNWTQAAAEWQIAWRRERQRGASARYRLRKRGVFYPTQRAQVVDIVAQNQNVIALTIDKQAKVSDVDIETLRQAHPQFSDLKAQSVHTAQLQVWALQAAKHAVLTAKRAFNNPSGALIHAAKCYQSGVWTPRTGVSTAATGAANTPQRPSCSA